MKASHLSVGRAIFILLLQ